MAISGAATGLGRKIAERFEAGGYRIHVCDASPASVDEFRAAHPQARASVVDVSNVKQVDSWFDEIAAASGRIDVLINNAGIAGPTGRVEEIQPADWDRTIAVLMNSSGRVASDRRAASLGKKLPTIRPAISATMNPASPVSLSDQAMLNFFTVSGVAAM